MRTFLTTLLLIAAAPAAHAKPEIRDVQAAHGLLGPERADTDYLPGDEVFFRFTVVGARTTDEGRLSGELRMTVTDAAGRTVLRQTSPVREALAFGGDRFPGKATVELGPDFPPGAYRLTVEFKDLASGESDSFTRAFTCKPAGFELVRVRLSTDAGGTAPAGASGPVGQPLHLKLRAVGFDRSEGEIDLEMEVRVLDARGEPVSPLAVRAAARSTDRDAVQAATHATFNAELTRSRPGDFTLRVTVTDRRTGKAATFDAPLRVTE